MFFVQVIAGAGLPLKCPDRVQVSPTFTIILSRMSSSRVGGSEEKCEKVCGVNLLCIRRDVVVSGLGPLTKLVLALHRFGGKRRFALSHLVDGRDPELVARSLLQSSERELSVHQFGVASYTYEVVAANGTRL